MYIMTNKYTAATVAHWTVERNLLRVDLAGVNRNVMMHQARVIRGYRAVNPKENSLRTRDIIYKRESKPKRYQQARGKLDYNWEWVSNCGAD